MEKVWRADGGWKCEAGAGHVRGMFGSCPRLILVAVVLWRFDVGVLLGGVSRKCNSRLLDALQWWARKTQRKGRFGEQMEVGSVRRVRGMFGVVCGGFDVGVLLGEAVAVC